MVLVLHARTIRAKNKPAMADDITTRPMLEVLLEGQRQLGSQMAELLAAIAAVSDKQDALAANQDTLAANQLELATKQDSLAVNQDTLGVRVAELTRQIEDGFDDTNRKIEIFNDRLLSFESWLKRVDRRLHDDTR